MTRSPPITAHLGRDVLPPAAGEHVRHERGVDVVAGLGVALDPVAGGHGDTVVVMGDDVLVPEVIRLK